MSSKVVDSSTAADGVRKKSPPPTTTTSSRSSSTSAVRMMSGLFMALTLILSSSASYILGRFCRSRKSTILGPLIAFQEDSILPFLLVPSLSTSRLFFPPIILEKSELASTENTTRKSNTSRAEKEEIDDDDDDEIIADYGDYYLPPVSPGAEHLMVDVTNVNAQLLRSPDRLEDALSTLLEENHHAFASDQVLMLRASSNSNPDDDDDDDTGGGGSFSVSVLSLQGQVFLHAFPSTGVLTLDVYLARSNLALDDEGEDNVDEDDEDDDATEEDVSLVSLVPVIQELFASNDDDDDSSGTSAPNFYWAIRHRGLDYARDTSDPADSADFRWHYLGSRSFVHKEHVTTVETPFQTFEVYDFVAMRDEDRKPDRMLFLDHVVQSNRLGMEAYHEALVHPALITHPNPKRVAIIGGGEGATLREVLKHKTVEKAVMIDIDGAMMNASRIELPEWNDCSDFVGSIGNCFDDPRAEVYAADAVGWFLDRYHGRTADEIAPEEKFDVIIMDALDPSSLVGFSDVLYGNEAFSRSMYNSLTDQGILIAQVGIADEPNDPAHQYNAESSASTKMQLLFHHVGFDYSLDYSELHCGFLAAWGYQIFFADAASAKTRWYASSAAIDLELSNRAIATVSGEFPFHYFDGSSMSTYQYPTRANQNVHCRSFPDAAGCRELGTNETSRATVTSASVYNSLPIMPSTTKLITKHSKGTKPIESAMDTFGYKHEMFGSSGVYVITDALPLRQVNSTTGSSTGGKTLQLDYDRLYHNGNSYVARNQELILSQAISVNSAMQACIDDDNEFQ